MDCGSVCRSETLTSDSPAVRGGVVEMETPMRYLVVLFLLAVLAAPGLADEIYLKDGSRVTGQIVEETETQVVVETASGRRTLNVESIQHIDRAAEEVTVLLKSGKTLQGRLLRETVSSLVLKTDYSQIEVAKIKIESIDGRQVFDADSGPADDGAVEPREVLVPAGSYSMGDSKGNDNPVHTVYVDAFWVDTHEVTNGQYREFVEATHHAPPALWDDPRASSDLQPVAGVTWDDARAYCSWAGKRLPSEAEWERAARGDQSRLYPWGDAFVAGHANTAHARRRQSVAVGSYPAGKSPFGLYDMCGNVWEWCSDWYAKGYYVTSPARNPTGPAEGKERVIRGGAYSSSEAHLAYRRKIRPDKTYRSLGFRCARTPTAEELEQLEDGDVE